MNLFSCKVNQANKINTIQTQGRLKGLQVYYANKLYIRKIYYTYSNRVKFISSISLYFQNGCTKIISY